MRTRSPAASASTSASLSGVVMSLMPSAPILTMLIDQRNRRHGIGEGSDEGVLLVALRSRPGPCHGLARPLHGPAQRDEQAHGEGPRTADAAGAVHEHVLTLAQATGRPGHDITKCLAGRRRTRIADADAISRPAQTGPFQRPPVRRGRVLDLR